MIDALTDERPRSSGAASIPSACRREARNPELDRDRRDRAAADLELDWVEYIPAYRTPALTGTGLGFARWS